MLKELTESYGTKYRIPGTWDDEYILPRTEFLLHTVKDIEKKLIEWCKQNRFSQGDSYHVRISNKGKWVVSYANDYPMQHGEGRAFTLNEQEFMDAMKIEIK